MKHTEPRTILLAGGWVLVLITVLLGGLAFLRPASQPIALTGIAVTAGISAIVIIAIAAHRLIAGGDLGQSPPSPAPWTFSKHRVPLAAVGYMLMASGFLGLQIGGASATVKILAISAMVVGLILVILVLRL